MNRVTHSLLGAGLTVALLGAVAPAGHAEPVDGPVLEAVGTAEAHESRTTGVTIGSARNQATGDVMGLGYEQVVRIEGSAVVIAEPAYRGGARIARFEAKLNTSWPNGGHQYYGQRNLDDTVKHQASRIAVLGTNIYVSRLYEFTSNGASRWDSVVSKYSADGTFQTSREFQNHAITALDAHKLNDREYLAIGLNRDGVRVAYADRPNLPDFRAVHEDWTGGERHDYFTGVDRDHATVVKLGVDHTGRLMLVSGKMTYARPAVIAMDLRVGVDGVGAAQHMWSNNLRSRTDHGTHWQFPDLVDFGALDPTGRPVVAIAWPSIGRVSFLDAATGADWTWVDRGAGAHAIRFFTDRDGNGLIAIARDSQNGSESYIIATSNSRGELVTVREGAKDDLPKVLAELTAP